MEWGERTGHFRATEWQETVRDLRRAKLNCKVGERIYFKHVRFGALACAEISVNSEAVGCTYRVGAECNSMARWGEGNG